MGVVYKAEDTKLKRTVALKFLPPDLTRDDEAKERFIHEAQSASALDHPNICNIHEIDETPDDQIFIVMAYYEGETLKKKIERGLIAIDQAIDIAIQVAQGLQKAHEHGIVHRDIKAANVMITSDGMAKVVDFGLAKLSGQTVLTKTGRTLGTVAYMSPEQARGEQVDHRSDIWSLGVTFYEMLTGKRPFESEYEQALVYSILNQDPRPMHELRPEVPEAIVKICRRAMAKDPNARYPTAAELISDLESYGAGTQLSLKTRNVIGKKRRLLYAGLAVAVLAMALVGILFFTGRGEVFDRVAVLPFHNISKDSTQEYLAYGMTEEVIARLQQIASLNVPSIRSSMKFKGSQASYAEIARELGAKALVDASIQSINNRVRVIARLVDPPTDRTLWSDTYDGSVEDILDLQSRIAQAVVREVRVKVSQDEQTRMSRSSRKVNPQAYELCLKARQDLNLLATSITKDLWNNLMAKLQRAIDIEPDNAFYYASLAVGYGDAIDNSLEPFSEAFPKMKTAAETAVKLDPDLAESQIAAGYVEYFQYNFDNALVRAARALALSPGNFKAGQLRGATLIILGRYEEALVIFRRANELDPIAYKDLGYNLGMCYFFMRRYDDAIAYLQQWLRQNPKSDFGHTFLALAFSSKGMHAEALAHNDSAPYWGIMNRPIFLAKAGHRALAMKAYEQNVSMMNSYSKAEFFALLGQKDSAFHWLQRFYREPSGDIIFLPHDPFLDNLRDDPRFGELLKAMHLRE